MKKIRRTRIRTETKRLVFIEEQSGKTDAHEFCPACGQKLHAPLKDIKALPPVCAALHDENGQEGVIESNQEE